MQIRFAKLLAAALISGATVAPASAASVFDFSNLTFNGGVNQGFLPTPLIPCTAGDLCSSNVDGNVRNGALTYTQGGIQVVATGTYNNAVAAVVQDHENGYVAHSIGAGLGVYHISGNTSDDNVTAGERLTLTFDRLVNLSSIELRSEGHNTTGWLTGASFLFNGASTLLQGTMSGLNLTGTTFTFAYGGTNADQFYLGAVTVSAVPEPGAFAMLVAGLGMLGCVARRRGEQGLV
jgi:hypothetical protein